MQEFDLYINAKKPGVGLYVPAGAKLPDFASSEDWIIDGTQAQDLVPSSIIEGVNANGHAFRNMD